MLPSFRGGGAERVLLTYFAHLDPNRVEKRLLALSGDGPLAGLVPPDAAPVCSIDAGCAIRAPTPSSVSRV